jgi:hypothetical protein
LSAVADARVRKLYCEPVTTTCDHCGADAGADNPPVTWSLAMERGQVKRYCDTCTRENLRGMEGKLDPEHW